MSTKRLLAAVALVMAVLSLMVTGYPLLLMAVVCLALSELA